MTYMSHMKPPPPEPHDFGDPVVMTLIHREAKRQIDLFYGWTQPGATIERYRVAEHREQVYVNAIAHACKCGTARIRGEEVLYWHPGEATWVRYDAEYNDYMLGFLRSFRERYQRGMQIHATMN